MSAPPIVVRPCASPADCDAVAALCGTSFPEECWGQGLSVQQWATLESEDLKARPSWWRQIGLACEGDRLLGVVVLTLESEEDDSISWGEYSRRVGCGPTVLSWLYDHVLDEPLLEHECLIDFIAVSPEARGKGVGSKLMRWAEETGATILADTEAAAVAARGVDMTLWVAADNAVACRLYQRSGYTIVKRTDSGLCHCMASHVLKWFLGHPVWIKMHKQLPVPEHLAARKPEQQTIPLTAAVPSEPAFVDVPLGQPAAARVQPADEPKATMGCWRQRPRQPQSAASAEAAAAQPGAHAAGLVRKLSSQKRDAASAAGTGRGSTSQGPTLRIAAVGSGMAATQEQHLYASFLATREGGALALHSVSSQAPALPTVAALKLEAGRTLPPSVASASVASVPLSDSDLSDGEEDVLTHPAAALGRVVPSPSQAGSGPGAAVAATSTTTAGSDVFQLVELSTCSVTGGAASAPAPALGLA